MKPIEMVVSVVATIWLDIRECAYAEEVGEMWERWEFAAAEADRMGILRPEEPAFKSGWGSLGEAVQKISSNLAMDFKLDWEFDGYGDYIKLYSGTQAQYLEYLAELKVRLQEFDRWVGL